VELAEVAFPAVHVRDRANLGIVVHAALAIARHVVIFTAI
jgi:predicted SPOUT superfamily RNA methylase MTH1